MSASRATLKALVEAFNAHDLDRIMSFFADDAVLEMPRGPHPWGNRYEGAAAVRAGTTGTIEPACRTCTTATTSTTSMATWASLNGH